MSADQFVLPGLRGRVALVTGANHGIGAATAQTLADCGAAVLVNFLRLDDPADAGVPDRYRLNRRRDVEDLVQVIRSAGGRAHAVEADLSAPLTPTALFDVAEQMLGPVEVLVNNASDWTADTFTPSRVDSSGRALQFVTAATVNRLLGVDARGAALLIAEFARRHVERGAHWGRIVGLTSGGSLGFPGEVSYGAAKAAQVSYTLSAAAELAQFGVTANVVHPPITDTGWVTAEVVASVDAGTEHFHVANPLDVARVIAFLASDLAALVTGNIVRLR